MPFVMYSYPIPHCYLITHPQQNVHPSSDSPNHDSCLAPPHRRAHRSLSFRRHCRFSPSQPSTRSLDSHHLVHPLGNRHSARDVRTSHLLSTSDPSRPATARGNSLGFPPHRSPRTRRLRNNAAWKSSYGYLPYHTHASTFTE